MSSADKYCLQCTKARISEALQAISAHYHERLPITELCSELEAEHANTSALLQALCNHVSTKQDHTLTVPVGAGLLFLQWHRLETTGQYEVTAYLS